MCASHQPLWPVFDKEKTFQFIVETSYLDENFVIKHLRTESFWYNGSLSRLMKTNVNSHSAEDVVISLIEWGSQLKKSFPRVISKCAKYSISEEKTSLLWADYLVLSECKVISKFYCLEF